MSRRYLVEVTRRRFIEVFAESDTEATISAASIYESGDACGELESATYDVVFVWEDGE